MFLTAIQGEALQVGSNPPLSLGLRLRRSERIHPNRMTRATHQTDRPRRFSGTLLRGGVSAGLALAAVLLFAPAVYGQGVAEADPPALPAEAQVEVRPATADAFGPPPWEKFAHRRSENARELKHWKHAKQAEALWNAAHLHLYSGERQEAFEDFSAAAEAALDAGRVYQAARANLRAAYVATDLLRMDAARRMMDRVRELRDSPRLTAAEREQLDVEIDRPYDFYIG